MFIYLFSYCLRCHFYPPEWGQIPQQLLQVQFLEECTVETLTHASASLDVRLLTLSVWAHSVCLVWCDQSSSCWNESIHSEGKDVQRAALSFVSSPRALVRVTVHVSGLLTTSPWCHMLAVQLSLNKAWRRRNEPRALSGLNESTKGQCLRIVQNVFISCSVALSDRETVLTVVHFYEILFSDANTLHFNSKPWIEIDCGGLDFRPQFVYFLMNWLNCFALRKTF